MKKFILDTNIIINDPALLKQWSPKCQVYLPSFVLREVNNFAKKNKQNAVVAEELHKLIEDDLARGFIRFAYIDPKQFKRPTPGLFRENRITTNDYLLAQFTYEFSLMKEGKDVTMVTDDVALYNYAKSIGLRALNLREYHSEMARYKSVSLAQAGERAAYGARWILRAMGPLAAGALLAVCAGFFINYFGLINTILGAGAMVALLAVLSIFLLGIRARWRLSYALLQVFLGLFVLYQGLGTALDLSAPSLLITLLAGIFLLMTGLDNLGKRARGTVAERLRAFIFKD
ncbi:MAG: hypothetical protein EPN93_14030 [Spirochaetes bacterium]|nr:MAG: hypothetical protein EPN93_14030 [Spirochaetota bacterium]